MRASILAALEDPAWEIRALAVAMCVRARLVDAAAALVDALEKEYSR